MLLLVASAANATGPNPWYEFPSSIGRKGPIESSGDILAVNVHTDRSAIVGMDLVITLRDRQNRIVFEVIDTSDPTSTEPVTFDPLQSLEPGVYAQSIVVSAFQFGSGYPLEASYYRYFRVEDGEVMEIDDEEFSDTVMPLVDGLDKDGNRVSLRLAPSATENAPPPQDGYTQAVRIDDRWAELIQLPENESIHNGLVEDGK